MSGLRSYPNQESPSPDLDPVIASIVRYAKPSRILLFGSRARKEARIDSDIDLCVLFDRLPKRKLEVLQDLYRNFYDIDIGAVDLVVYEERAFKERAEVGNSFEAHISEEGVALYGPA